MSALIHLRDGVSFREARVHCGISPATAGRFFPHFVAWLRGLGESGWVRPPTTRAELAAVEAPYASMGFPGCTGSMDGTHVKAAVPFGLHAMFKGKESYTSYQFNAHCTHSGRVTSIAPIQPGSYNDITAFAQDGFAQDVGSQPLFTGYEYPIYTADGGRETMTGAWIMCDRGYQRLPFLICPADGMNLAEHQWSKRLESVRKVRPRRTPPSPLNQLISVKP